MTRAGEPVAVLGAGGTMGFPMARNLARAGVPVRAWNRSREKAEPLAADGAAIAGSPAEAADGAGIVLTMLADTGAVTATMDGGQGALAAMPPEAVWLQMSTVGEAGTQRCAQLAAHHGAGFVDAPVLGTRQPAEERKLVVLASGPAGLRDRVQPVFGAVGQKAIAECDFRPSFRLSLAAKDAGLVRDAAARHGLDLPVLAAIAQRLSEGAREHGDQDMAATYLTSAPGQAA